MEEIFTPEKIKKMEDEARRKQIEEDIRSGEYVPYYGPKPEEFGEIGHGADKVAAKNANRIKLGPRPEFIKKSAAEDTAAENYGWLNAWQDKNEIDRGERKNKN